MPALAHTLPGMQLQHRLRAAWTYARPSGETIEVFARSWWHRQAGDNADLIFFWGRDSIATRLPGLGGWIKRALKSFACCCSTSAAPGLSTPVTGQTLRRWARRPQAAICSTFAPTTSWRRRGDPQAIGGTTVDRAGQSLAVSARCTICRRRQTHCRSADHRRDSAAGSPTDDIYRATHRASSAKNRLYYQRYPDDVARERRFVAPGDARGRHAVRRSPDA